MAHQGIFFEPVFIEKPVGHAGPIVALNLIQQRQNTLAAKLRDELQKSGVITGELLESLFQISRALRMSNVPVVELIVSTLLDKTTELSEARVFVMLKACAFKDKDAAYECALAYMGMGRFKQEKNVVAAKFLYYATRLGHPIAFYTMLDAISDNHLVIRGDVFLKYCKKLVTETKNLNVAIAIGTLLCGFDIEDHENLRSKLNIHDPDAGFDYLRIVQVCARKEGNTELSEIAFLTISKGYQQNIYTSAAAQKYRATLIPITANSDLSEAPRAFSL